MLAAFALRTVRAPVSRWYIVCCRGIQAPGHSHGRARYFCATTGLENSATLKNIRKIERAPQQYPYSIRPHTLIVKNPTAIVSPKQNPSLSHGPPNLPCSIMNDDIPRRVTLIELACLGYISLCVSPLANHIMLALLQFQHTLTGSNPGHHLALNQHWHSMHFYVCADGIRHQRLYYQL